MAVRQFLRARFYRGAKIHFLLIFAPAGILLGSDFPKPCHADCVAENPSKYFFGFFKNSSAPHPVFLLLPEYPAAVKEPLQREKASKPPQ